MKFRTKAGLAIGGIAVLLGGAVTASSLMDATWLRTRLVEAVDQQTGRQLRIDSLHVWLLPYPWVEAKGVSFSNRAGGARPEMFTAREVRARLTLGALFSHRVVLDNVSLMEPELLLERTPDGEPNWLFGPAQSLHDGGASSGSHRHWNLALSSVHVRDGGLIWSDVRQHLTGEVDVDRADITGLTGSAVSLSLRGHHDAGAFTLAGTTGPILPVTGESWPVHLTGTLVVSRRQAGQLHVDGVITDPQHDAGYDLQIGGTLGQLADLQALFPKASLPDADDVSLQAGVTGSGASPGLRMLHLHTGAVDLDRVLEGLHADTVTLDASQPADRLTVALDGKLGDQAVILRGMLGTPDQTIQAIRTPDASALPVKLSLEDGDSSVTLDGVAGGEKTSLDVHGSLPALTFAPGKPSLQGLKVDGHLASAAPVSVLRAHDPQAWLRAAQATLDVAAQRVTWQSVAWDAVSAHVVADGGRLTADPIRASGTGVAQGMAQSGRFGYDASGDVPNMTVTASPLVLPAEVVEGWAGIPSLVNGSLQVVGSIAADGADMNAWKRSAAGHVGVSMVGGRVSGQALAAIIGRGIPVRGAMGLRCFGIHMQIADDRATLERIGLEADMLSLTGHGSVGLSSGALDLHLTPRIGIGGTGASSPVGVGGTISSPQPHLEPGSDGRFAIAIGGAQSGGGDQCPDLLATAREGGAGPAAAPAPAGKANGLMNMLKGLLR
ncbi:AsmA family protein [Acetobacter fallax]|uniref:AsmA family protein n=1 Tax=Acetobacter fallax TaxID=1737473 RepID=A0ABX0KB09_9PROT|nr:AsmA family protein [Acetobacter fallax]NHO33595.1 AsmA family protein [Acetobacter fallax]NHO37159.1 AsmA family protein [Acetobacter fallax]